MGKIRFLKWFGFGVIFLCVGSIPVGDTKGVAHDHTWQELATISPTCEEDGKIIWSCTCGEEKAESILAIGHEMATVAAQEATCEAIGWEEHLSCVRCGKGERVEYPALGHEIVEYEGLAVTCMQNGWEAYQTCQRCDFTTFSEIITNGHDYETTGVLQEETCTETGLAVVSCKNCDESNEEIISALGHKFKTVEAQDPTCSSVGWNEHKTCVRCEYTTKREIDSLPHDWDSGEETQFGVLYTCKVCDAEEIRGHNHVWESEEIIQEATCSKTGKKDVVCVCGFEDVIEIPKTEHDVVEVKGREATCTKVGKTEGGKCRVCGEIVIKQKLLSALGHDWDEGVFTADGIVYTCGRCNQTRCSDQPHKHDYKNAQIEKEATCEEAGLQVRYCACGDRIEEEIPAKGHAFENGICQRCEKEEFVDEEESSIQDSTGTESREESSEEESSIEEESSEEESISEETSSEESTSEEDTSEENEKEFSLTQGKLIYELNEDNTGYICGGADDKNCMEIVIPDTYDGLPVTEIKSSAFLQYKRLLRVTIGANIEEVGKNAFYGCSYIVEVYNRSALSQTELGIFGNLTTVRTGGFSDTWQVDEQGFVLYEKENRVHLVGYVGQAKNVEIPKGVTVICPYAFADCNIQKISIPSSVKEIREAAFLEIIGLQEIVFEEEAVWIVADTPIVVSLLTAAKLKEHFTAIYYKNVWRKE